MSEARFHGTGVSPGIAIGRPLLFSRAQARERAQIPRSPEESRAAVETALERATKFLEDIAAHTRDSEARGIIEAQQLMVQDPALLEDLEERLKLGATAEESVEGAFDRFIGELSSVDNEYIGERAADLSDAKMTVLSCLGGESASLDARLSMEKGPVIVVTTELLPSDASVLQGDRVIGVIAEKGGQTSHAAILSRRFGVPAIFGVRQYSSMISMISPSCSLVMDGGSGDVVVEPMESTLDSYRRKRAQGSIMSAQLARAASADALTLDGHQIRVEANMGNSSELGEIVSSGADGVGLLRTEFLLAGRESIPDEEEQFEIYSEIASALVPKPVTVRTFDIGGDKPLSFLQLPHENNPFLGVRGVRLTMARRELLIPQLRAILRASVFGRVEIMFPMVTLPGEVDELRQIVLDEKKSLEATGTRVGDVRLGIMVEVPSIALTADSLGGKLAFFSVGSNDLTQYTLASDRTNDGVSSIFDQFSPAVLKLISMVSRSASRHGVDVAICGEMAADIDAIPFLIGLGVRSLSVSPPGIARTKEAVRRLSLRKARLASARVLRLASADEARAYSRARFPELGDLR